MLKLKQYFCRHDFKQIATHNSTSQDLYKCTNCGVYSIHHYGMNVSYKSKTPHIEGWDYKSI